MPEPDVPTAQAAAVDKALSQLDLDTKCRILAGQDNWSLPAVESIGLGSIVMSDGPVGVRGVVWSGDPAVALPSPTAQAASWDADLAQRSGRLLGAEARRKGVHVLLAPTINLQRSPLGGRHFEAHSEDPLLTGVMATALIRGVSQMGVATTAKHFVANDAETDRFTVDNIIDERTLRELYLAPFEMTVTHGRTWGVMSAYNQVNGASMTEHDRLQNRVLRREWGFDGFIVSDWTAARDTVRAALGGTDVAMPGPRTVYGDALATAVRQGGVAEPVVDALVRRVLMLAARVGRLADAPPSVDGSDLPVVSDPGGHAREVARRSFVLAHNRGDVLPLPAHPGRVALIGLPAAEPRVLGGGSAQVFPPYVSTPLDALRTALPAGTELRFVPALDPRTKLPPVREGFGLHWTARDAGGAELGAEPMAEGQLVWLGEAPSGVDLAQVTHVEVTGEFTPAVTGLHEFSVAGIGRMCLAVDGSTRLEDELTGDDNPVRAIMDPPERRVRVALTADVPVSISLTCDIAALDVAFDLLSLRLGHADPLPGTDEGIRHAAETAAASDYAIVTVATTESVESEGFDREDLRLPGRQDELVSAVAAANPRTIVVVSSGSPVELPWSDEVAAILLTWFGGQEFGNALADVLTGTHEPGGRLPTTWPAKLADAPVQQVAPTDGELHYREGGFIGYRAWQRHDTAPAFWFGEGQGYTTWHYDEPQWTPNGDDAGTLTVPVTNTGSRPGREVVQVYLESLDTGDDRPHRWLAGFASVTADPGQTTVAKVKLPRRAFQVWDTAANDWTDRTGRYRVHAAHSLVDTRSSVELP